MRQKFESWITVQCSDCRFNGSLCRYVMLCICTDIVCGVIDSIVFSLNRFFKMRFDYYLPSVQKMTS